MPLFDTKLDTIDTARVRNFAKSRGADLPEDFIADACIETLQLAKPAGTFRQCVYDATSHSILCDAPFTLKGQQMTEYLSSAAMLFAAAVTIGMDAEKAIDKYYMNKDYEMGMALDCAATIATVQVAEALTKYIGEIAEPKGYKLSWRVSPGMGDWPQSQERDAAKAAHGEDIGLGLTAGGMVTPRKSIVALFGLQYTGSSCGGSCSGCAFAGHCGGE